MLEATQEPNNSGLRSAADLSEIDRLRQEIAELKQERLEVGRVETFFRLMADNVADLLAIIDPQGCRVWNNSAYFRILGYQPEALEGTYSMAEIHPEDQARIEKMFQSSLNSGIGHKAEYRIRHRQGHWVLLESKVRVVTNEKGEVDYLVLAAQDITERRRAESELLKTKGHRVVSKLARGLSQEFDRFLISLNESLQQLEASAGTALPESSRIHLDTARAATREAGKSLQHILDLGHGEPEQMQEINLKHFLTEQAALSFSNKDIQPSLRFYPSAHRLMGNPSILSHAIKGILNNAVESMQGQGPISIQVEKSPSIWLPAIVPRN
ncbi:MAG: PAS domain S-box protein [Blastochloris sp.]|nr:PAS domain S-box protein [Blastochloris sp.]